MVIATKSRDLESLSEDEYSEENVGDNGNGNGLKDISQIYFPCMGKYPLLTRRQEIELAKEIRKGTSYRRVRYGKKKIRYKFIMLERTKEAEAAAQKLVLHNLPLVISIAKRYIGFGVPFEDLVQEGNSASIRAANGYRYWKSKFSTYVTSAITKAIYRLLQQSNKANRVVSLDKMISENPEIKYIDMILDTKAYEPGKDPETIKYENEILVRSLLEQLDEPDRRIIISRYFKKKKLYEVGEELGVSKERARQLQNRALKKLREPVEAAGFG